jgi:hypothetical protein
MLPARMMHRHDDAAERGLKPVAPPVINFDRRQISNGCPVSHGQQSSFRFKTKTHKKEAEKNYGLHLELILFLDSNLIERKKGRFFSSQTIITL